MHNAKFFIYLIRPYRDYYTVHSQSDYYTVEEIPNSRSPNKRDGDLVWIRQAIIWDSWPHKQTKDHQGRWGTRILNRQEGILKRKAFANQVQHQIRFFCFFVSINVHQTEVYTWQFSKRGNFLQLEGLQNRNHKGIYSAQPQVKMQELVVSSSNTKGLNAHETYCWSSNHHRVGSWVHECQKHPPIVQHVFEESSKGYTLI